MKIDWQIKVEDPRFLILTVEGEVWCEVYKSLFLRSLKTLKRCSSEKELKRVFEELEGKIANDHCVWLLSRRAYSSFELKGKLKDKKIGERAAEAAVQKCTQLGYLNDEALVHNVIERHRQNGKGDRFIAQALKKRLGYTPPLPRDPDREREAIGRLIEQFAKKRKLSDPKERRRLLGRLQRRGFPLGAIFEQLNQ